MHRFATALLAIAAATSALANVTVFQQGRSPAADYTGCIDTTMRGRGWARERCN